MYRISIGTPRNLHMLLLADANKRLDWTHGTVGTPRNLHVLLLADAKKRLDCTEFP